MRCDAFCSGRQADSECLTPASPSDISKGGLLHIVVVSSGDGGDLYYVYLMGRWFAHRVKGLTHTFLTLSLLREPWTCLDNELPYCGHPERPPPCSLTQ